MEASSEKIEIDKVNQPTDKNPPEKNKLNQDNQWLPTLSLAIFILLCLASVIFLYFQNQTLKSKLASYTNQISSFDECSKIPDSKILESFPEVCVAPNGKQFVKPVNTPIPAQGMPTISSPSAESKVKSPLNVIGTVPPGWMFEGVFPIKLTDNNQNVISQGQAKEKNAGAWQSGATVDFTASITFKNASGSGFLILENSNPSGDPSKKQTYEIPVNF